MPCDCPSCQKDNILNGTIKGKCSCCQCELDALSKFKVMNEKEPLVCEKCVDEHYIVCNNCQKFHKRTDTKKTKFRDVEDAAICPRCFAQYFRECDECHKFFDRHEVLGHEDKSYCRPCFEKSFQSCNKCAVIKPRGSMSHFETAASRIDGKMGKQSLCDNCWNYYGPINQYSTKPEMVFRGKPPHYYGVELEVEVENHKKEERGCKAQEVMELFGDFAIVKEDGSLNVGFEICTQPATLDEHITRWGKFFDHQPKNLISFNSKNCGLHVHCSKKPLTLLTVAKMVVFVNEETNIKFIETIAGRNSNSYSVIAAKKHNHVIKMRRQQENRREFRYEAINLVNPDTIEFRIFKGTLKRESFFKALEFCDALIQFCMMGNNSISYCKSQKNFMDYVGLRSKDYPHLYAFMCAKFLKQETKLTKQFGFSIPRLKPATETVKPETETVPQPILIRRNNRQPEPVVEVPNIETDNQI